MSGALQNFSKQRIANLLVKLMVGFLPTALAGADEQDVTSGSVAAAIREAGHPCAHVIQMDRLKGGAAEGFTAWDVRCNSGRFKVTFTDGSGSEVVPFD